MKRIKCKNIFKTTYKKVYLLPPFPPASVGEQYSSFSKHLPVFHPLHLSFSSTPLRAESICCPQPCHVAKEQLAHETFLHILEFSWHASSASRAGKNQTVPAEPSDFPREIAQRSFLPGYTLLQHIHTLPWFIYKVIILDTMIPDPSPCCRFLYFHSHFFCSILNH